MIKIRKLVLAYSNTDIQEDKQEKKHVTEWTVFYYLQSMWAEQGETSACELNLSGVNN